MTTLAHKTTRHARPLLGLRRRPGRLRPEQRFLSEDESVAVAIEFRTRHPWRLRLFSAILGWGDLSTEKAVRELVSGRPFVSFRPASEAQPR